MMLNIGPKGDGTFPEDDVNTLKYFAQWMESYSESIHGTQRTPLPPQNWGVVTSRENVLYLHVFDWPEDGKLQLAGLTGKANSALLMKENKKLQIKQLENNILQISVPKNPTHPAISVIKTTCDTKPAGDGYRLLETQRQNRLHVFDYTTFTGSDIRPARGKGTDAYVHRWKDPDSKITWKVRQVETQKYNVHMLYDLPKKGTFNDSYELSIGDQVLQGKVSRESTGKAEILDAEIKLMRLNEDFLRSMPTEIYADDLGEITLKPGTFEIELGAGDEIKRAELFRPRAIILKPLDHGN